MSFDVGNVRPVSGGTPSPQPKGTALAIFKGGGPLVVHVDSLRKAGGGALATTGARLATGFFTGGGIITAGVLASLGAASPSAAGVAVTLLAANYVTKLVFSKPLVAIGALIAGERPGQAIKQVFG